VRTLVASPRRASLIECSTRVDPEIQHAPIGSALHGSIRAPEFLHAPTVADLVLFPSRVLAEKRIALLIGNQGYAPEVGPLKDPHEDISIVGAVLAKVGIEILAPLRDATRDQIRYAAHDLADRLRGT